MKDYYRRGSRETQQNCSRLNMTEETGQLNAKHKPWFSFVT